MFILDIQMYICIPFTNHILREIKLLGKYDHETEIKTIFWCDSREEVITVADEIDVWKIECCNPFQIMAPEVKRFICKINNSF